MIIDVIQFIFGSALGLALYCVLCYLFKDYKKSWVAFCTLCSVILVVEFFYEPQETLYRVALCFAFCTVAFLIYSWYKRRQERKRLLDTMVEYAKSDVERAVSIMETHRREKREAWEWCSIYGYICPPDHVCAVGVCYNEYQDGQELEDTVDQRIAKAEKRWNEIIKEKKE